MKIHAFKVVKNNTSSPLEDIFKDINSEPSLEKRIRNLDGYNIRAEACLEENSLWFIDFVKIRTEHGPGKAGLASEVEGFEFNDGEGFGEETAALYDPVNHYILIQYNHYGVRANSIADYFSAYRSASAGSSSLYTFIPKYDQDVERRMLAQGITKKVRFSLDLSRMSAQDRERGVSLSKAIDYGREMGSDRVTVEISVRGGKAKSLDDKARVVVDSLRSLLASNDEAVKGLEISGKENADAITETLDLIAHRLCLDIEIEPGDDLRYPKEDRWEALLRARNGWTNVLR